MISYITTTQPVADLTFESTAIDYPNGSTTFVSDSTLLSTFLGADAGTLSGSGAINLTGSVFRFTGYLDLAAGAHTFSVGSDDGFRLIVNGVELGSANDRGFGVTNMTATVAAGLSAFELVYYENGGFTGVEFKVDGAYAVPAAAVPLPAGLPLLGAGLAALGIVARRKA